MSEKPLVSVITIFLNGEAFLEEAVESVLAQTYPHWELVMVNDGSTDGSAEIARRYAARCPEQVRYLTHPKCENRGMSASRNLGIHAARGQFIALLDADDLYLPEKLEHQVALLQAHPPAALVYGPTMHWYSWTGREEDRQRDRLRKLGVPTEQMVYPPELPIRFLRHQAWTPGTCGALIRREAVEAVGGFEEMFTGMFEDQAFFYKLLLKFPAYVESGSWDRYRQHPASAVSLALQERSFDPRQPNPSHRHFYNWLEGYLLSQGVSNRELWAALRSELWPYRHPRWHRTIAAIKQAKSWLLNRM